MEEKECSMEQVIENLQKQVDDLKMELAKMTNDKDYWVKCWSDEFNKNKVYVKRLQAMQHTIALLAGMIGEVDVTALTKEEKA